MKNELDLGTSLDQVTKWLPDTEPKDPNDFYHHYESATGREALVFKHSTGWRHYETT